ncbi:carbohydrate esterase [Perilla frutescens var. hirtella]|nr:carbohydrate esterase [Perilla frutescens var. hirtella]
MGMTVLMVLASLVIAAASPIFSSAVGCNVIILAGQSNMVGQGGVVTFENGTSNYWDRRTPPECSSNPQILGLNNELLWEEAQDPLHNGISLSNCSQTQSDQGHGVGPGMPFSNSLLKRDPTFGVIGLVPCAVGGTSIVEWRRGSCLYKRMLRRVGAALLEGGVLRGMLWYQGESDAVTLDLAHMYKMRLETFFTDLRSDLNCPSLPIIQVALASGGKVPGAREIVREAQLNISLQNVKCVDAAGLPLNTDNLHLTTHSQVRLGSMMADVFLRCFN